MSDIDLSKNRLPDPDRAYRMLIDAHRGLSDEASAALNARLVLILANQLGEAVLSAAIALARAEPHLNRPPSGA